MKMQIEGAVIIEQGVTFAIVIVKKQILHAPDKESLRRSFSQLFGNIPVIFMVQNGNGVPTYDGRTDIAAFLSAVHPSRIPWKRYTVE